MIRKDVLEKLLSTKTTPELYVFLYLELFCIILLFSLLPFKKKKKQLCTLALNLNDMAQKRMTLISPCTGLGNRHPRKGHSPREPFPPFSNLVGMEIERAWGNFTINQSSASLLRRRRETGSQMTNPFFSQSRNYNWVAV